MPSSSDSRDPRPTWDRLALIATIVPQWLLQPIVRIARRIILFVGRRSLHQDYPRYQGITLWTDGTNADMYLQRLKTVLDLLNAHAPVYLRWLRSNFRGLLVSQLFLTVRGTTSPEYGARLIMIHPDTTWKVSPDELAIYLAGDATLARLGRRFRQRGVATPRANRRALREMVACARLLPSGESLIARTQQWLAEFDARFPDAAA